MQRNEPRTLGQLHRAEDGVATVEFSIVFFFILVPLFIGIAVFGWALWQHQAATKGVRDATRYLTRVADPLALDAQAQATSLLAYGELDGGAPPAGWSLAVTTASPGGTFRREPLIVTVTATVDLGAVPNSLAGLLGVLGLGPGLTLTVTDQARHYGE
jgi:hypothetical protein